MKGFIALIAAAALALSCGEKKDVQSFQLDKEASAEKELSPQAIHSYSISLARGQFLKVVCEQRGVDVVLTAFSPDNKKIKEVDSPNGSYGEEPLALTAEAEGAYRFEIRTLEPTAKPGKYVMKIEALLSEKEYKEYGIVKIDSTLYDKYAGSYELNPDHHVILTYENYAGTEPNLCLLDMKTFEWKVLRPHTDKHFLVGPSPTKEYPVVEEYVFTTDDGGKPTGMRITKKGEPEKIAKRVRHYRQEEVSFQNKDVVLKGKLLIPDGAARRPAFVLAHGSGPATRNMGIFDSFLAHQGAAVLAFDKRGVGGSTGNWQAASFEDLAADVLAGVEFLKKRADIDPERIGILGGSQGGWIGSLAAAKSDAVKFLVVVCGSGVTVAENVTHEAEGRMRDGNLGEADIQEGKTFARKIFEAASNGASWEAITELKKQANGKPWAPFIFLYNAPQNSVQWNWFKLNGNVNPSVILPAVKCPVLWYLADHDWNVPSKISESAINEALKRGGNKDFVVKTFSPAAHMMLESQTGLLRDRGVIRGFVPGYWDSMSEWVRGHISR